MPLKYVLYTALHKLIATHPMLSAIPVGEDTDHPAFVRMPMIDLDTAHGETFPPTGPFWRVVVSNYDEDTGEFMLTFVYHHALGDGMSGLVFHRALQKALPTHIEDIPATVDMVSPPDTPLLPPLENFFDINELPPTPPTPSPLPEDIWTGGTFSRTNIRTKVRGVRISAATLSRMQTQCREENTTITAFLQAITAHAFLSTAGSEYTSTIVAGAIRGVWEESRRGRRNIQTLLDTRNISRVLKPGIVTAESLEANIGGRREYGGIEVSNVGVFDGGGGVWMVESMFFSQCASIVGAAVQFSVVSVKDGEIVIGVSWQEGVVSGEAVERGIEEIVRGVEAALL
ncbi:hypothetical protein BDD12DRAFT_874835 [Trichophaea hybrida]|nr:hypothetical protein BDD12DRAFT_874835 [Trichophaea hybrida]